MTGAMNFFRALMASFTVAAFAAILLMALGADISLGGEHRGPVNSIPAADMIVGVPLRVRCRRGPAGLRLAVHGPDGREAAGRPGHAGGDGGVGRTTPAPARALGYPWAAI